MNRHAEIGKSGQPRREFLINQGNIDPEIFVVKKREKIPFKDLLNIMCCPLCKHDLDSLLIEDFLFCTHCKRRYKIIDGIPNMLVEQSEIMK
jgi:uncharacterized protein YbaR (Trm112 family)